jgi:hypothetical protein
MNQGHTDQLRADDIARQLLRDLFSVIRLPDIVADRRLDIVANALALVLLRLGGRLFEIHLGKGDQPPCTDVIQSDRFEKRRQLLFIGWQVFFSDIYISIVFCFTFGKRFSTAPAIDKRPEHGHCCTSSGLVEQADGDEESPDVRRAVFLDEPKAAGSLRDRMRVCP